MLRAIVTDPAFLSRPCLPPQSREEIGPVVTDLLETARYHKTNCAGLAANQIGYPLRCFVMKRGDNFVPVINPKILGKAGGIAAAPEGCLSKPGATPVVKRRAKEVILQYFKISGELVRQKFAGFEARVVQHEMDHLEGIVI